MAPRLRFLGSIVLVFASIDLATAQVVDVLGGTSSAATSSNFKGNCVRVDVERTLTLMEFRLDFTGQQELGFYVYQGDQEFGGFDLIYQSTPLVTGTGDDWYATDSLSISLEPGQFYIFGVSWPGSLTYYFNTGGSQAISFGEHLHAQATGVHVMPPTLTRTTDDSAIYYQRLTTLDPAGGGPTFTRGDANDDSVFDISDVVFSLAALFIVGSDAPTCLDAADVNDDGTFDVSDSVYGLASLFIPGSPEPLPPFPDCDVDPSDDLLDCVAFIGCP